MPRTINRLAFLALALFILGFASCNVLITTETPTPTEKSFTSTPAQETPEPTATSPLDEIIVERTPFPTALPGPIQQEVEQIVRRAGLSRTKILGLNVTHWVDLLLSLIYVLIGYLLGSYLVKKAFLHISRHAPQDINHQYIQRIGGNLRWFITVIAAYYSIRRLAFLSIPLMTLLLDICYSIGLFLTYRITILLIRLTEDWYHRKSIEEKREKETIRIITLLVRLSTIIAAMVFVSVYLSHFGINVTAFAAALGIGGLAFSLAARDTIADAIAGFVLLVDKPFRIGDGIEIQGVDTWGDVIDIGLRTTHIRTRDNRMVIVPNSIIGKNQIVNYSYPDPQYRIETHVHIAYGTDIEKVRALMIDTVRSLEDVLDDRPVDALYVEMGDYAMIFRIRWWIKSFVDAGRVRDRVNTALQISLDEAGIVSPYPIRSVHLNLDTEKPDQLSAYLKETQQRKTDNEANKTPSGE